MVAKLRRAHLRDCARKALERRGYSVKDISRMGVAPGAQLRISKASETYRVAVRSSLERKVGIVRKPSGDWMTVPCVDFVVVVTPSAEQPNCAEILCFPSATIIKAFDKVLAARKERNPDFSPKAPLFVPLDPVERGKAIHPGLKELAEWQDDVSLASVPSQKSSEREGVSAFVARVTREFAQKFGAKEEDVTVSIHIKQGTRNSEGFALLGIRRLIAGHGLAAAHAFVTKGRATGAFRGRQPMLFDIVNFAWRPGWRLRRHSHRRCGLWGILWARKHGRVPQARNRLGGTGAERRSAAAGLTSPEYPQDPRIDPMIVGGEVRRNITLREIDRNRDSRAALRQADDGHRIQGDFAKGG